MSTILYVTSSPRGTASFSSQVSKALLGELQHADPGARLVVRDLARDELPHIGEDFVAATRSAAGLRSAPARRVRMPWSTNWQRPTSSSLRRR